MEDRNIKKLWDKNQKRFIKEFSIMQTINSDGKVEHTYFERNSKTQELEQLPTSHVEEIDCLGLTDKNGKLIYEGDIVTSSNPLIKENLEVYYDNFHNAFMTKSKYGKYGIWFESFKYEIIGNIYENPELLEVNNGF